jgi:twitching motility two-component system response regulator PilH
VKTILIVEDEAGIAEVLVILLEQEQFAVVAAANGREALEALKQSKPDAILTDVMMPLMSGPDFCKLVRADPAFADIPIVFQTSVEEWAVREYFEDFDAFFLKPYQMKELVAALHALTEGGRASRQRPSPPPESQAKPDVQGLDLEAPGPDVPIS